MLNFWGKYPALRLLILFVAGVLLYILLPQGWYIATAATVISFVALIVFINAKKLWLKQHVFYSAGAVVASLVVSCAYLLTHFYTQHNFPNHYSKLIHVGDYIIVQIAEPPTEKPKSVKAEVSVRQIVRNGNFINVSGKLLLNFAKDSSMPPPKYGDVLVVNVLPQPIEPPLNPAQFNYKRYLGFRNIDMQAFVSKGEWKVLDYNRGNKFLAAVYKLREGLMYEIVKFIKTPDELGVAGALLLGNRDYVTPGVNRAYAATGILHLLSVSGLHVGMVFLILSKLLFFMERTRRQQLAQIIIIIILIWAYACLTGLSPSVLRSATMFSMIAGGKAFKQRPNIYNILGASALLLVILNPYVIADIGFQLSYLAVGGIVYLYPVVYSWIAIKNKVLDWLWTCSAVSIAAQATTFPLALLYFHQFPNYFLLSNLVVIPAGYIQMISGIAMFLLKWIPQLQSIAGSVFYYSTYFINQFTYFIEALPYSLWQGISISLIEMVAIYAIVFLLADLFQKLRAKTLYAFLITVLFLVSWNSIQLYSTMQQQQLVVYAIKQTQAICVIKGNTAYTLLGEDSLGVSYLPPVEMQQHLWQMGVNQHKKLSELPYCERFSYGYAFSLNGKRIVVQDRHIRYTPQYPIKADAVILTSNIKTSVTGMLKTFSTPVIIADETIQGFMISRWNAQAEALGVQLFNIRTQGAYIM